MSSPYESVLFRGERTRGSDFGALFSPVNPTFEVGEFHSVGEVYVGNTPINSILL